MNPEPDSDELLAEGDRLLESSRRLLADLDSALDRASGSTTPQPAPADEHTLDLAELERRSGADVNPH